MDEKKIDMFLEIYRNNVKIKRNDVKTDYMCNLHRQNYEKKCRKNLICKRYLDIQGIPKKKIAEINQLLF